MEKLQTKTPDTTYHFEPKLTENICTALILKFTPKEQLDGEKLISSRNVKKFSKTSYTTSQIFDMTELAGLNIKINTLAKLLDCQPVFASDNAADISKELDRDVRKHIPVTFKDQDKSRELIFTTLLKLAIIERSTLPPTLKNGLLKEIKPQTVINSDTLSKSLDIGIGQILNELIHKLQNIQTIDISNLQKLEESALADYLGKRGLEPKAFMNMEDKAIQKWVLNNLRPAEQRIVNGKQEGFYKFVFRDISDDHYNQIVKFNFGLEKLSAFWAVLAPSAEVQMDAFQVQEIAPQKQTPLHAIRMEFCDQLTKITNVQPTYLFYLRKCHKIETIDFSTIQNAEIVVFKHVSALKEITNIPKDVKASSKIERLHLSNCGELKIEKSFLKNLTHLKELTLGVKLLKNSQISEEEVKEIFKGSTCQLKIKDTEDTCTIM